MSILSSLLLTALVTPEDFHALRERIPQAWIEDALQEFGVATVRRRRLPAEQVVWLVVGMALFRDHAIEQVVDRLDLVLDPARGPLSSGAVPSARAKVGEEPLEWLFTTCANAWALQSAQANRWRGLALFGIDGTSIKVADTPENREHFGGPSEVGARAHTPWCVLPH